MLTISPQVSILLILLAAAGVAACMVFANLRSGTCGGMCLHCGINEADYIIDGNNICAECARKLYVGQ